MPINHERVDEFNPLTVPTIRCVITNMNISEQSIMEIKNLGCL